MDYCAGQVDYGMVHRGLCRELFTLSGRTEKRKYSWRYETSIYFLGKNLELKYYQMDYAGTHNFIF